MGTKRRATSDDGGRWSAQLLASFDALTTNGHTPLLSEVRDVLMDKLLGDDCTAGPNHVVVLVLQDAPVDALAVAVDGLPSDTKTDLLPAVRLAEGDAIPKCEATLLYAPVSKAEKDAAKKQLKKAVKNKIKKFKKAHHDVKGPEFYLAEDADLVKIVPIPSNELATTFVETRPLAEGQQLVHALLAIDCEMCKTTKGVELARVSIVDDQHKVVLDEFVLPSNPVVDYCTQFSGITREILEGCTNTLASIQARLVDLISAETILVGHSLENDLQALRLIHRRVIDTVLLYPHPKGPPFRSALRYLASTYLKIQIQTGDDGHCSVEDAACAMKLLQLKIQYGPLFPSIIAQDSHPRKLITELCHRKKSALIVDTAAACRSLAGSAAAAIPCTSPDLVFHHIRHQLTTGFPPTFTWGQASCPDQVAELVRDVATDLPSKSLLLVVCCPSVQDLKAMHKLRTTRGDPRCTLQWDKTQQDKLNEVAATAQRGRVVLVAKDEADE
ncbi:hypothetical protein H310_02195 [Aphanomyces invadans]|uniref:Exonuclease domain-containing protein n=1 Tax=Aphanomyces invadans TaxID=157072 RepID=A0A024UQ24_9STRA|nr:hypothetical protein H310_02195 [Aphanomyces invadans]ETW07753.1 hypothetical protein H310_02195 [Aphanomyces invadans]|eukprot:XP_008863846.1 hypothetical protein H310_02195 [Aphanomyces invadans]